MNELQQTGMVFERSFPGKRRKWNLQPQRLIKGILILCIIAFAVTGIILLKNAFNAAADAARDSYEHSFEEEKTEVYTTIYDSAFDKAEAKYHITGRASISIEGMREIEKLEIMSVMNDEFIVIEDKEKEREAWYEATAEGTFTIDMSTAEYIIDRERQHVLVRSPRPVLENIKVSNTKLLFETQSSILNKESYSTGFHDALEVETETRAKMKNEIRVNQYLQDEVVKRAESALQDLVKQFNPNVPNLRVDVEFMD